jgi:hypothetical protein
MTDLEAAKMAAQDHLDEDRRRTRVTQQSAVFKTPDFVPSVYLRRTEGPEAVTSDV